MTNAGAQTRAETCLSDFGLDRLRFDELSGEEERAARAHVSSCLRCARQLKSLQAADAVAAPLSVEKRKGLSLVRVDSEPVRVTAEPPRVSAEPLPVAPAPLKSAPPRSVRRWVAPLGLAAGVALAVALWPTPPTERLKGSVPFAVYAQPPAGVVQSVTPDTALSPGTVIRFAVSPTAPAFVWVVGFDTAQVVSLYVASAGLLEGGKTHLLPEAIQLDETLGPERLVALFCPEPLTRAQVHDAGQRALVRAAGAPRAVTELALGCEEHSLVIEKKSP